MPHNPSIAIDVEVKIMSYSNGMRYSEFHPDNPFTRHRMSKPLPFWQGINILNSHKSNYRNEYWIIEEELTITPPAFDIKKAFNCFNLVPTAGATYTLKLCVDVPDNNNPMLLPPETGSETGHTFIVVSKRNGNKSVTQVFGFYAERHPGYLSPFKSMPSIIRNNQLREINASIEIALTSQQFDALRVNAFELAKRKYAAVDYNCSNYGMDVFNGVSSTPLIVESYKVSLPYVSSMYANSPIYKMDINKTPQMIFKRLKELKDSKSPEASLITIDQTGKTFAPASHGECNY